MDVTIHTSRTAAIPVVAHPCAKINLSLEILGRRRDGFHDLASLAIGVDVRDRLGVSRRATSGVSITCHVPALADGSNLAACAAELLFTRFQLSGGLDLELTKRIPVAAGLGGGSADAAAVLALCNDLFALRLQRDELAALGSEIGSDVSLYSYLPCAWVRGRGDIVRPTNMRWSGWVLLVVTGERVSTAEVYGDLRPTEHAAAPREVSVLCGAESAAELNVLLTNQLEPAVFRVAPGVASVFDELHQRGYGPFRVSGAGSVLYKLFDDFSAARKASEELASACPRVTTMVVAAPASFAPWTKEGERNGNH